MGSLESGRRDFTRRLGGEGVFELIKGDEDAHAEFKKAVAEMVASVLRLKIRIVVPTERKSLLQDGQKEPVGLFPLSAGEIVGGVRMLDAKAIGGTVEFEH